MTFAAANGIELCYETFGDSADPPLLLVMGLGAQMTLWDSEFCELLAAGGRHVIRFDNRDCGLSTKFDDDAIDMAALLEAGPTGEAPPVPYDLSDMAADAIGLLDHLGIASAHIVGASMGGMIVQTMALEHRSRVRSMTSIMSTTGEPEYFQSDPDAIAGLLTPQPEDRAGAIAASIEVTRIIGSKRYFDEERARDSAARSYDRSFYPAGFTRQLAAIQASGSRGEALPTLDVPTLVIHGRDDTLILPVGGFRTAELVPHADLLMVGDMGHDLPVPLWPLVTAAILAHTTRSDAPLP